MSFFNFFSQNIGIDLGTSNTLVYVHGKGITVNEPSVVAIKVYDNTVCAAGMEAKEMLERTPQNIRAIRPLQSGVIADFEVTIAMIGYFIRKALNKKRLRKANVVICVPVGVTSIEKRAVEEVAHDAGAKRVKLVEEPMAAAIGAGLPVSEPIGNMVVDIGGGTTEIAVISLGGIVVSDSVRIAGDDIDIQIKEYIKWKYKLDIGLISAEKIKKVLGNACSEYYDLDFVNEDSNDKNNSKKKTKDIDEFKERDIDETKENNENTLVDDILIDKIKSNDKVDSIKDIEIIESISQDISIEEKYMKEKLLRGRDIVTGLPRSILVTSDEIREASIETIDNIVNGIKRTLEKTPPELASDIYVNGIFLTGGGALFRGLDIYIEKETGLKVHVANKPLECVALGAGKICETM